MAEVLTLVTTVLALVTAAAVLANTVVSWRTRRELRDVHVLVNSRWSAMVKRLGQLTKALEGSDTAVPPPGREES